MRSWHPRHAALLAFVALIVIPAVIKAISVAPHAVFMGDRTRSGEVALANAGAKPEEVTVDVRFGYPDTDSSGTPFIHFVDQPGVDQPSAAGWIRAYPRRVRLEPGDKQSVRLLANPPSDLPDGEYWARLIVSARGGSLPVAGGDSLVRAGVTLEIRIVSSITYRKGAVRTGVTVTGFAPTVERDSLIVWLDAAREGNAAYLGTAHFGLVDRAGQAAKEWSVPIAIYHPIRRRFGFPLESLRPGAYRLKLTLAAVREDLDKKDVLPAPTVRDSADVTVP